MTDERLEAMVDEFEEIKSLIDKALEAKKEGDYDRARRLVNQYDETVKDELYYWGVDYDMLEDTDLIVDTENLI
ncbi:hypothetical protein [Lactobacillus phage PMBT4]|nr:hypothetical protein [Lactobacillus phage PMBT4]